MSICQYITPQHWNIGNKSVFPGKHARIKGISGVGFDLMQEYVSGSKRGNQNVCGEIKFHREIPSDILSKINKRFPGCPAPTAESFVVVAGANIEAYSQSERGMLYAAQDIINLTGPDGFPEGFLYNYPVCPVRGVKLLLPGVSQIEDFKKFIDLLCRYKYNTLILEIGGAMEYKRHPEINAAWIDYCMEMNEYSGKAMSILGEYSRCHKNAIHSENGGGGVLSQAQVRELISYCHGRMIDIIPEEPTLSHSDYLLLAHKDLAERREDPYPDAYCPMNPASYKLVFELLDEIIEVFNPSVINIGHDEYYSFKLCDRCRDLSAPQIYADDINIIHGYLSKKGVQTMLWGDKLLDAHFRDGNPCGGAQNEYFDATYSAIDLIPKDLQILHWYWGIDRKLEQSYAKRGLDVIYGNFDGPMFVEWNTRLSANNIRGAIISNWGTMDLQTLQRNTVLFNVVYTALLFWNRNYGDQHFEELRELTFNELGRCRELDQNLASDALHIKHVTDHKLRYFYFSNGSYIDNSKYIVGHYELTCADGAIVKIPVIYGLNIMSRDVNWDRKPSSQYDAYECDRHLFEVAYTTVPEKTSDGTWYHYRIANPWPGKEIKQIRFVRAPIFKGDVWFEILPDGKGQNQIKVIKEPPSIMPSWQETMANGWIIPWQGLAGGAYIQVYNHKCHPLRRDVLCLRRGDPEKAVVRASLTLAADDRMPTQIEVEGLDNDKPEVALMEVLVNGKSIYDGTVPFLKDTWVWRSIDIPLGLLKHGRNIVEFRNITSSNCTNECMGWYMISGLRFIY